MSEHAFDDKDMTGDFLPEDSQRLLAQIKQHIQALAKWAQPSDADDTHATAQDQHRHEFMACLGPLAEQLELVLKAVSRSVQREAPDVARSAMGTDHQERVEAKFHDTELEDEAPELASTDWASPYEDEFICGVTLDQIDQLNRLVERIKAYGDAVSANGAADFAPGTLSILGHTIFDRAVELDALVSDIYTQTLEQDARPHSVRETPPAYCAKPAPRLGLESGHVVMLSGSAQVLHSRSSAPLLH
jgi:hypothetical protein